MFYSFIDQTRVIQSSRLKVRSSLALLILLCSVVALAQSDRKDSRDYESLARKAYKDKEYASFLANMQIAADLGINHPRLMYNLAAAYALNNKPCEALSVLKRGAEMGLVFPIATDPWPIIPKVFFSLT